MNRIQTIPSSSGTTDEKPKTTLVVTSTPVKFKGVAPGRFTEMSLPRRDRVEDDD